MEPKPHEGAPTPLKSESSESLETLNERMKILEDITEEFTREVSSTLQEYEDASRVVYNQEGGFDDSLKRQKLIDLVIKLSAFESGVKSTFDSFDQNDGGSGLNDLFFAVKNVRERLVAAPDVRYDQQAQIDAHGGRENVPLNKVLDTFEHTQTAISDLKGQIRGIKIALQFMHPTKVVQ